ncbi:hypothetical protein Cgig2_003828 [Carnegiea gigantea]|uniref:Uncharacterized protein n=1 Tax=Carnegiea gigantea TaxID=171969 RepID=A0A9Q1KNQ1_9CARY|nr:hypothetical protein Cgig2_003828 [Carnegiea gigantea]
MAREPANVEKKVECFSLDIRSLKVPSPPPWTNTNFGFNKVVGQVNGIGTSSNIRSYDLSAVLDCEIPDAAPISNSDSGCELLEALKAATLTSYRRRLYFLRVLLHAYKEVVFYEGVVVRTARFSDLSLWASRYPISQSPLHLLTLLGNSVTSSPLRL